MATTLSYRFIANGKLLTNDIPIANSELTSLNSGDRYEFTARSTFVINYKRLAFVHDDQFDKMVMTFYGALLAEGED